MAGKTILIRKYENRRLYDTTNSRYVNLDDVARLLQHGDDVRVTDAATGDDITRLILTQIIVEGAKTQDSGFPLDILRDMVIATGRASQENAVRYTQAMLDLYKSTYRAMTPAFNPFEFVPSAGVAGGPRAPAPEPDAGGEKQEVTNLKQRVAELEKLVSSLADGKKPSRPSKAKTRRPKG